MDFMILGYILAILIGLSLGLLGGGGSILTVPVLVYIMHMDTKLSIALSLAIVGFTSLIGVFQHFKKGHVNVKIAIIFGFIAMLGAVIGTKISQFISGQVQLLLFAFIMLLASIFMLRGRKGLQTAPQRTKGALYIIFFVVQGFFVGVITGLVGVGGGFLIVPALVLLVQLPMKQAVGTSLLIIVLNTLSGFVSYAEFIEIPWRFLMFFSLFSSIGIIGGTHLVQFISQEKLRKAFAVFLIFMGFFILYKNKNILWNIGSLL